MWEHYLYLDTHFTPVSLICLTVSLTFSCDLLLCSTKLKIMQQLTKLELHTKLILFLKFSKWNQCYLIHIKTPTNVRQK